MKRVRSLRSAKSINTKKLEALEAEFAALRSEVANLRAAYNCHTHTFQPTPLYYWNGYQYVRM